MQLIVSKKSYIALCIAYVITLLCFTVYSYVLIDLNLTLFGNAAWAEFRDMAVEIGYYQRETSWYIYLTLSLLLFAFHIAFVRLYKKYNPFKLALITGGILLFAYPFLSHDLFNYLFDAKILTYYHQNPYLHKALDYPMDDWIRFMHWTHRNYPYGPIFLPITLVPSFLSFGKFIIDYFLFKALFVGCYVLSVYLLTKLNARWGMFFATHPFILIEGVINSHNDLMQLALAIVGVFYLFQDRQIISRVYLVLSAGIKYISLPVLFLTKNNWRGSNYIALTGQVLLLLVLCQQRGIQQWYFLALFVFLPFFEKGVMRLNIFFLGLVLSYYPYIRFDGWVGEGNVEMKDTIIYWFLGINVLYLAVKFMYEKKGLPKLSRI